MKKFWIVSHCNQGAKGANNVPAIGVVAYFAAKQDAIDDMKRRAGANTKSGQAPMEWYVLEAIVTAQVPVPDIAVTELKD